MVRLKFLGGTVVEGGPGSGMELASRRHPLAILALLATAPSRTLGRGKLVGLLWPDVPEATARNRLNTYVHRIRSELGEDVLVSVGDELSLAAGAVRCDVLDFEEALEAGHLERAAELYDGPFLDGFALSGSAAFEHRVDRERARLGRAYRDAVETLARAAGTRGEVRSAVRWWRKRADEDPHDGGVIRRLMEALAAADNRAEAVRVAAVHARLLREELGVEPSPEIFELAGTLREAPRGGRGSGAVPGEPEEVGLSPGASPSGPSRDAVEASGRPEEPPPAARGTRRRRGIAAAAALLVAAGLAAGALLLTRGAGEGAGAERPAVAVLPFEVVGSRSPDPVEQGIHTGLLTRLAAVGGLKVISGTTVAGYRGTGASIGRISDELGARWILEGTVQHSGDEIEVNAQLIDARTDAHAWARAYRRKLTAGELFDIQADIATSIARELRARLTPAEVRRVERAPTRDLEAYRLYVEGRRQMGLRTRDGLDRAVGEFRRAIELDSSFALAWAGLADAPFLYEQYLYPPPPDLPDPERAARRALQLEPDLAEGHASLASVHLSRYDGPGALRELRRAVELEPSYAEAQAWLGYVLCLTGPLDEALQHLSLAIELEPDLVHAYGNRGWIYLAAGAPERTLADARRREALLPDSSTPYRLARRDEALALYSMGRREEARRISLAGIANPRDSMVPGYGSLLALIDVAEGDTAAARRRLLRLKETGPVPLLVATVHAALGESDSAFAALRRQRPLGAGGVLYLRCWFPDVLDALRSDPRFGDVVEAQRVDWGFPRDAWADHATACSLPEGDLATSADARRSEGGVSRRRP